MGVTAWTCPNGLGCGDRTPQWCRECADAGRRVLALPPLPDASRARDALPPGWSHEADAARGARAREIIVGEVALRDAVERAMVGPGGIRVSEEAFHFRVGSRMFVVRVESFEVRA